MDNVSKMVLATLAAFILLAAGVLFVVLDDDEPQREHVVITGPEEMFK